MSIQRAGELQVEATLTNFSIGYKPANLIADKVLPIINVGQETGIYYEWDRGLSFQAPPSLRADGTRPNTVQLRAKKVSFSLEEYALEIGMTDREEKNVPREVSRFAKRNAAIRDLIKYTNTSLLVNGDLPPTFFGLTVWTPGAYQEGSPVADNITEVWGNDVIVAYIPGTPMVDTPALGYTFRMGDFTTYTWREDALTTNWIRPSVLQTEKLTYASAGYILRSAI
jgi:hypothetical protein